MRRVGESFGWRLRGWSSDVAPKSHSSGSLKLHRQMLLSLPQSSGRRVFDNESNGEPTDSAVSVCRGSKWEDVSVLQGVAFYIEKSSSLWPQTACRS